MKPQTYSNLPAERFANFPAGSLIQGPVPVIYEGECVGAIGVSGVQSSQDEQIARAGLTALK